MKAGELFTGLRLKRMYPDFTVWVDSDSCPSAVRNIVAEKILLLREEGRTCRAVFAANREIPLPEGEGLLFERVSGEKESADDFILSSAGPDDLVLTKDFLLARRTLVKGIRTMNFDGRVFEGEWLEKRIEERNIMEVLYNSGSLSRYRKKDRPDIKNREFGLSFSREIDKILQKGE